MTTTTTTTTTMADRPQRRHREAQDPQPTDLDERLTQLRRRTAALVPLTPLTSPLTPSAVPAVLGNVHRRPQNSLRSYPYHHFALPVQHPRPVVSSPSQTQITTTFLVVSRSRPQSPHQSPLQSSTTHRQTPSRCAAPQNPSPFPTQPAALTPPAPHHLSESGSPSPASFSITARTTLCASASSLVPPALYPLQSPRVTTSLRPLHRPIPLHSRSRPIPTAHPPHRPCLIAPQPVVVLGATTEAPTSSLFSSRNSIAPSLTLRRR